MPYIRPEDRERLRYVTHQHSQISVRNEGELNYLITDLVSNYLAEHGHKYSTMNAIVGALTSATTEFQRRIVTPYEDSKIEENGDVYNVT